MTMRRRDFVKLGALLALPLDDLLALREEETAVSGPASLPPEIAEALDPVPEGFVRFELMSGDRVLLQHESRWHWEGDGRNLTMVLDDPPGDLTFTATEEIVITGYRVRDSAGIMTEVPWIQHLEPGSTVTSNVPNPLATT